MKKQEITLNELEAQQICFALEHEIKNVMRDKNTLDWILYETKELQQIHFKIKKIMED